MTVAENKKSIEDLLAKVEDLSSRLVDAELAIVELRVEADRANTGIASIAGQALLASERAKRALLIVGAKP